MIRWLSCPRPKMVVVPEEIVSHVHGFGPRKQLRVGSLFLALDPDEQFAVVCHEVAHCKKFHSEQRVLWLLTLRFFFPSWLRASCVKQELAADAEVGECGYALALARVIAKHGAHGGDWHPSGAERLENLRPYLEQVRA